MLNVHYAGLLILFKYLKHNDLRVMNVIVAKNFSQDTKILTGDLEYYALTAMFLDLEFNKKKN
ncbi:hypothetical protein LCGC14_1515570 [marine sediment metagenome]|uniref:Uncharacterized protein n=1 Tax=marine sediment metagenome TaxID=412755 RepID=A0A0F9M1A1_9ZZZZ